MRRIWLMGVVECFCILVMFPRVGPVTMARAQQGAIPDEQRRFLDVRRRQIDLTAARAALTRMQELFKLGLVPQTDLDHAKTAVDTAQLNYQEAVLSLLSGDVFRPSPIHARLRLFKVLFYVKTLAAKAERLLARTMPRPTARSGKA